MLVTAPVDFHRMPPSPHHSPTPTFLFFIPLSLCIADNIQAVPTPRSSSLTSSPRLVLVALTPGRVVGGQRVECCKTRYRKTISQVHPWDSTHGLSPSPPNTFHGGEMCFSFAVTFPTCDCSYSDCFEPEAPGAGWVPALAATDYCIVQMV